MANYLWNFRFIDQNFIVESSEAETKLLFSNWIIYKTVSVWPFKRISFLFEKNSWIIILLSTQYTKHYLPLRNKEHIDVEKVCL